MYTQCPDCATVFRVTAEALRAAQGDVRCGVCSTSFNALENLSEQAFKAAPQEDATSPDDSMTVEELPGGENIELSAPVELVAVPDLPEAAAPAEPRETADDEARAMEFHGDAAELDRLFVVENPTLEAFEPPVDLDSTDEHPILVLEESDTPDEEEAGESIVLETPPEVAEPVPEPAKPAPAAPATASFTAPRILIPEEMRRRLAAEAAAREDAASAFEPAWIGTPRVKRCGSSISRSDEKLFEWPLCGVAVRNRRCSKRWATSRTALVNWLSTA